MSWIGVECKRRIPYNKRARKVNPKIYEDIWEYAKVLYLYLATKREGLNNAAYFHPRYIEGELVSDDGDFVIDHIKKVISFHKDKQWFIAPYIAGKH
ncbi:hypothetical protein Hdeb2414_s0008g00283381 [Helianthus debilis subsp. tardiflorus]